MENLYLSHLFSPLLKRRWSTVAILLCLSMPAFCVVALVLLQSVGLRRTFVSICQYLSFALIDSCKKKLRVVVDLLAYVGSFSSCSPSASCKFKMFVVIDSILQIRFQCVPSMVFLSTVSGVLHSTFYNVIVASNDTSEKRW